MPHNKTPGTDGYTSEFFVAAWKIVRTLVISAAKEFFSSSKLLRQVNSTAIALIPKVQHPTKVKEFRPISCCNIIYKCIAKILANRL